MTDTLTTPDRPGRPRADDLEALAADPVERLLLAGEAATVGEAEERYLDGALAEALALLAGPLSDEELGRHPLFALYRSRGSRPREDSLL